MLTSSFIGLFAKWSGGLFVGVSFSFWAICTGRRAGLWRRLGRLSGRSLWRGFGGCSLLMIPRDWGFGRILLLQICLSLRPPGSILQGQQSWGPGSLPPCNRECKSKSFTSYYQKLRRQSDCKILSSGLGSFQLKKHSFWGWDCFLSAWNWKG